MKFKRNRDQKQFHQNNLINIQKRCIIHPQKGETKNPFYIFRIIYQFPKVLLDKTWSLFYFFLRIFSTAIEKRINLPFFSSKIRIPAKEN